MKKKQKTGHSNDWLFQKWGEIFDMMLDMTSLKKYSIANGMEDLLQEEGFIRPFTLTMSGHFTVLKELRGIKKIIKYLEVEKASFDLI